jgi:hypothetical protein
MASPLALVPSDKNPNVRRWKQLAPNVSPTISTLPPAFEESEESLSSWRQEIDPIPEKAYWTSRDDCPDGNREGPKRHVFYNPFLDPYVQEHKMTEAMLEAVRSGKYMFSTGGGGPIHIPDLDHPTNLISSLCEDGLHRPCFDVDVEFTPEALAERLESFGLGKLVIVPSNTAGHHHVYAPDEPLEWEEYVELLDALVHHDIVDTRYVRHARNNGHTFLRAPGVQKYVGKGLPPKPKFEFDPNYRKNNPGRYPTDDEYADSRMRDYENLPVEHERGTFHPSYESRRNVFIKELDLLGRATFDRYPGDPVHEEEPF